MDGVDAKRRDYKITDAEGTVERDEEMQALLDSVTKSEHMKSKSRSPSISSDSSNEEDFFQIDATPIGNSISSAQNNSSAELVSLLGTAEYTPHVGVGSQLASEANVGGGEAAGDGNPTPEAEAGDPDSSTLLEEKQTPLSPVAGQIAGYDPNRIPAAVFGTPRATNPVDWSIASNESLFSIHVENSSFSREHGLQIARSGDLGNPPYSPPEADSPLPLSLNPGEVHLDAAYDMDQAAATTAVNAQTMEDVLRAAAGTRDNGYLGIPYTASAPRQSDASSIHSFAFPILAGGTKSLKVVPEQQSEWQKHPGLVQMESPRGLPKPPQQSKWLQCFSCSLCHSE
uniref:Uncharacterized protein n=1 Tax=Anthurium amnicola TaxID=1678845 RepID=A0A1D1Y182_9ARAE